MMIRRVPELTVGERLGLRVLGEPVGLLQEHVAGLLEGRVGLQHLVDEDRARAVALLDVA